MNGEPTWQGLLDAAIVSALGELPPLTRLRWNDPAIHPRSGFATGWVAVTMSPVCGLLGLEQACEVFGSEAFARGIRPRALHIVMEPDAVAVERTRAGRTETALIRPCAGRSVAAEVEERCAEGEYAEAVRSVAGITQRLAGRIRQLTGRTDLAVVWDPTVMPLSLSDLVPKTHARPDAGIARRPEILDRAGARDEEAIADEVRARPIARAMWTPGPVTRPALRRTI
ncbi:MAG TPA: hypothetical protein VFO60_11325 [Candidatus Dormibacteraeota bacterium]|nr:hypothetical protein [Candidatus Dormibacteraeota bacterium]